jgi:hypothetical protein
MKHPTVFFEDEVLFICCQLVFRIVFIEDIYVVGQSLLMGPWFPGIPGPFQRCDFL